MITWETVRLGNISSIKGGKRLPAGTSLIKNVNSHPYIRVRDLNNVSTIEITNEFEYVDDQTYKKIARYTVSEGDIILSIVGTIGLVAVVGETLDKANLTENCVKITKLAEEYNKKFIFYYLCSPRGQNEIRKGIVGAVQAKLPLKNISAIEIPMMPIDKQERIAKVLSSIDDKIELNTKINHNLEEQIITWFEKLFVNNPQCSKWKHGTIADLGKVVGGSTPSKAKSEYYTSNGIAWITPKDLSSNKAKFISSGGMDITPLGLKNSSAVIMPRGTVLFSSRAPIGYIAIAKNEVTTNQGFKSVIPHIDIGTAFVYCFLKYNLSQIESRASGSTFKEVSGSVMKSVPAFIPNAEMLERFSAHCQPLFDQQELLESEGARLAQLRDSLLPKLMSGEIDVSEVEV